MRLQSVVVVLIFFLIIVPSYQNIFENFIAESDETARKKKKRGGTSKLTVPLLFGALMIKSIIFPLAFKAMAVMTSIAVLLSTLSLIMSSIVGYIKMGLKPASVKVVHKPPYNNWAKDDDVKHNYALGDYDLSPPALQSPYTYTK